MSGNGNEKLIGYRVVTMHATGDERTGNFFETVAEAMAEVAAMANEIADSPEGTYDVVGVEVRPVTHA